MSWRTRPSWVAWEPGPLAGLAVAGIVLSSAFSVFNFLAYSTTAGVARSLGSGDRRRAAELGGMACGWPLGSGAR